MPEFTAANVQAMHSKLERAGTIAMRRGLTSIALAGEKQAKLNASNGAHAKGTKTPATKGQGPAVVTGNLRRNITHDRVRQSGTVLHTRVGVADGAPYGKHVEALGYTFLEPVVGFLRTIVGPVVKEQIRRALRDIR